jgi:hypothetical protein
MIEFVRNTENISRVAAYVVSLVILDTNLHITNAHVLEQFVHKSFTNYV